MASEHTPLLHPPVTRRHDVENGYGTVHINGTADSVADVAAESSVKEDLTDETELEFDDDDDMSRNIASQGGGSNPTVESLDYEIVESEVYKEDWRSRTPAEQYQYIVLKWVFVLLIGIGTGLASFGINMAVENLAGIKFQTVLYFTSNGWHFWGCLFYTACNMGLVLAASILCVFVGPAATGSGIPEVKAYLNGVDVPNILAPSTLFVKIFGSIGSVGGGLVVGKEGPLVHTGACIAALLGQGGSRRFGLDCKWLRFFKNDRDRRDLVTCGAAAGVAAAFRAPVGGVLFALEEVTSWWRSPLLWRAFFTNAVVAVVLRTAMAWCENGNCGLYSSGGFIIFDEFNLSTTYGLLELAPVAVLGVLGGILGSLFNQLNLVICTLRRDSLSRMSPWVKVADAGFIAILTSVVQFTLPWVVSCKPCPSDSSHFECPSQGRIGNFKSFNCPAGQYNDLASLMFNTNDDVIRNLFSAGTEREFSYQALLITLVSMYSLSLITYGIAVPSGLFVPAILCGATYGRLVGRFMVTVIGSTRVNEGTYALLGSASFLGGSMRMTVSICVILLELTGNLAMLPLMMLVLLVAKTVGDVFNHAIYDTHLRFKRVPLLEAHPPQFMKRLEAMDAVRDQPVTFEVVERVGRIFEILSSTTHNAFPVVYGPGSEKEGLYGVILRSHLLVLLKGKRAFQLSQDRLLGKGHTGTNGYSSVFDFGKSGSGKGLRIQDIKLKEEEMDMFLDLHTFANRSPYTVSEGMTLSQVYTLFRQLGLRHLFVVPSPQKVLGVITRKDLLSDSFEGRINRNGNERNMVGTTSVSML